MGSRILAQTIKFTERRSGCHSAESLFLEKEEWRALLRRNFEEIYKFVVDNMTAENHNLTVDIDNENIILKKENLYNTKCSLPL